MRSIIEYLNSRPFMQVPRWLYDFELSVYARQLFIVLLDLAKLAEQNKQMDEKGVYVYYTLEQAQKSLQCSKNKAIKSFREIEEQQLILRAQRGCNKANIYYILLPDMPPDSEPVPQTMPAFAPKTEGFVPQKAPIYSCPGSTLDHDAIMNNYRPPF